jgi:hypothetical protein
MIKIEYWNSYDILDCHYEGDYKNRFWLDVDVQKPTYLISREQVEDSLGDAHNTWLKWEKQYTFDFFCLEHMADFLSMITMHDNVWVEFENGYSGKCRDFMFDIKWTDVLNVGQATITFVVKSYTINGASASNCS